VIFNARKDTSIRKENTLNVLSFSTAGIRRRTASLPDIHEHASKRPRLDELPPFPSVHM
jgi:hypothetical protein